MNANVNDILGERVLATIGDSSYPRGVVEEYKILELSPSGNWLKVMNSNGRKFWRSIQHVQLIEILVDLKADKPVEDGMPVTIVSSPAARTLL